MIVVIVEFETAAENRGKVLEVLSVDSQAAKKRSGCLGFKILRVTGSETGWVLVEEWQDMAAFDAYKASTDFARTGEALMALMLAPPRSRAFEAPLPEA